MSKKKILFLISGFLPFISLLGKPIDPTLWIYSVFVFVYFLSPKIIPSIKRIPLNNSIKFFLIVILSGLLVEFFAWLGEYFSCSKVPVLFHPQLFYDWLIGIAFYAGWAFSWFLILRKYKFSLLQVFLTQGLFGVVVEQHGTVFIQGLMTMPLGLYFWFYVFVVYGSTAGLFYVLTRDILPFKNQVDQKRKYFFLAIMLLVFSMSFLFIWHLLLQLLSFPPSPQPICKNPLW